MKNFFRFLLVFIGVILVYVYNNPEVVDKYKKDLTDFSESDSAVIVERDDVDKEKLTESDKTIATEKEDNVDNSQSAPIVVEKKSVNNDEIKFKSRKTIVRDKIRLTLRLSML